MADSKDPETSIDEEVDNGEMSETEIDQNLADTFPASDPPSWTLGNPHDPVPRNKSAKETRGSEDSETD